MAGLLWFSVELAGKERMTRLHVITGFPSRAWWFIWRGKEIVSDTAGEGTVKVRTALGLVMVFLPYWQSV